MVESAPRIDARLLNAILELDRPSNAVAETNRLIGARARELGLPRPSYAQIRRLVLAARELREEQRARREEIMVLLADVLAGRNPPDWRS